MRSPEEGFRFLREALDSAVVRLQVHLRAALDSAVVKATDSEAKFFASD